MNTRCIIVDDNEKDIRKIASIINELQQIYPLEVVKTFTSSVNALSEIPKYNYDLIFVDYEMPGYSGVELIQKLNTRVPVVFVTGFPEMSINIINKVNSAGFLPKPIQKERLIQLLKDKNLLDKPLNSKIPNIKIIIPSGKKDYFFERNEIYYIKSDGKYKDIYGENGAIEKGIDISFDSLCELLPNRYEKVSKSHIVNMDRIRMKDKVRIILDNKHEINIGETQKVSFKNKLKNFFSL